MNKELISLYKGIGTFIPGIKIIRSKLDKHSLNGVDVKKIARYCYSVWMRHISIAKENNLHIYPEKVAELGPGISLGTGLASLLSGSKKYFAFDIVKHTGIKINLKILEQLVDLFKQRSPIPDEHEFPKVKPYLNNYNFPYKIYSENMLKKSLKKSRIERIRNSIININAPNSMIQYKVPCDHNCILKNEPVDMIFSQAVLEFVNDLQSTYKAMYSLINPSGFISNQIDFKCHGNANVWNGHWEYSELTWSIIKGKRAYYLNREPHSKHLHILKNAGFKLICDKKILLGSKLNRQDLAPQFKSISKKDLKTADAFIQAVKIN